jgi:LysR family hydrogen peroxide-inducible transcriptional activator
MSINISIRQIEYALTLKRSGSFSAAAKSCFVSQPALSEAIQKFEAEIGVLLFDRSKNPVQVTEVGEALLKQAHIVLTECQNLIEIADTWNDQVRGVLRMGLIPTLAPSLIPLFLKSFRKKYPLVKIEIVEQGTDQLLQKLENGDLDGAILSTPATAPGYLIEKTLFYEAFLIYAGKGNDLLNAELVAFPDLEDQNLILMDETHCVRDQILAICERKKDHTNKTTVHGGIHTLLSVVDEENGFTLVPELLSSVVNKSQLRMIKASNYRRKISLLCRKSHPKKRLVDLLVEEILENLPDHIPTKLTQKIHIVDPDKKRF